MNLIFFGATGMVGAGALREALADPNVATVLSVSRRPCGVVHPKLRELLMSDLFDITAVEGQIIGLDACVWAVGISSMGLDEAAYAKVTEELTLLWARTLLRLNPAFSFCYCSAAGAGGSSMWARVRQRVEGEIKAMPFRHAGCVRPAIFERRSRARKSDERSARQMDLGPFPPHGSEPRPSHALRDVRRALRIRRRLKFGSTMAKTLVCRCEDVTLHELEEAIARGHDDLESLKRYTGFGTGWCQGKNCVALCARELTKRGGTAELPITPRPPFHPMTLADLAGLADVAEEDAQAGRPAR